RTWRPHRAPPHRRSRRRRPRSAPGSAPAWAPVAAGGPPPPRPAPGPGAALPRPGLGPCAQPSSVYGIDNLVYGAYSVLRTRRERGAAMNVAIEVSGLRKAFGAVDVLDGIDLSVRRGTVHALLGPNGAGKTTLVSILATLVRPDAGTARVAGVDLLTEPNQVRRRIALTGQSAAVDDVLTAEENLRMMARLRGLRGPAVRRRAGELIAQFGLVEAAGRQVKTFSGGMRRRLDLALSVVVAADVVFLDEPTTGLDPRSRRELWQVISGLRTGGTTVLLTTQYLEGADGIADPASIPGNGAIAAEGTPAELKRTVGEERVELRDELGTLLPAEPTDGTSAGLRRALDVIDGLGLAGELMVRRPSLDDVFFALTETAAALPALTRATPAADTRPLASTGRIQR